MCENLKLFSWASGSPEGRKGDYFIEDGVLYSLYPYLDSSYGIWMMFCYPAGKSASEFQIPTKCNSMGEYCFYKQRHLKTILFHDKLKNIGNYSFYGCEGLSSLNIPAGVSKIGISAFEDCSSLETVTIPGSVTQIDKRAFASCSKLNTVTIENGVETIDSEAFANCDALETIIIPASVININERAFAGCSNLKTVILQLGTRKYGADVFEGCNSLKEVRIADISGWCESDFATPLSNPAYLSKRINYLGEIITELIMPTTTTHIGQNAFYGYTPLKSVTIHNDLRSVSKDAFYGCDNLEKVKISDLTSWCNIEFASETSNPLTYAKSLSLNDQRIDILNIPKGVDKIGKYAFVNGNFNQIRLSSSVNVIEDAAFKGTYPTSIHCLNTIPPTIVNSAFSDYSATLFVPTEAKSSYRVHEIWGLFVDIKDIPVEAVSISLDKTDFEMNVYDTLSLNVAFNPIETTDKTLFWNSSDGSIAKVEDGVITALKKGIVIIKATTINNKSAFCQVTIKDVLADNITLIPSELMLHPGFSAKLAVTILPENTTNKALSWRSEYEDIVKVRQDGVVNAISEGSALITVSTLDGSNLSARCLVTVSSLDVSSISLNPSSIIGEEGEQIQVNATILPEDATNKTLAWSSSDEHVAIVDENGLVSLIKEGTATITASATDGSGVSARCTVVVTGDSGIDAILADKNTYVKIFSLSGVLVYEGQYAEAKLVPDYYIVVCDGKSMKVKVE